MRVAMTDRPTSKVRRRKGGPLSISQILAWADAHRAATGKWPTLHTGTVLAAPQENWHAIDVALRIGGRRLPRGGSLARLLSVYRGRRNRQALPRLTLEEIVAWADEHHRRTGKRPARSSGPVSAADGETWFGVDEALQKGRRGLPGGSSLSEVIRQNRGDWLPWPRLTIEQILRWADAHQQRTGRLPSVDSGPVKGVPGQTWRAIDRALTRGNRGLPGGCSLARLLAEKRNCITT
jgi:hypothetical protein